MSLLNFVLSNIGRLGRGAARPEPRESVGDSVPVVAPPTPPWYDLLGGTDDDPAILPDGYDGSQTLPDRGWKGMTTGTQGAYIHLEAQAKRVGIDFFMTEGFRPRRRQAFLYAQGRKRVDGKWVKDPHATQGIVTNALPGKSNHQSGRAFDIAIRGGNPYDKDLLAKVGALAPAVGLEWGGLWEKLPDAPHFQLKASV